MRHDTEMMIIGYLGAVLQIGIGFGFYLHSGRLLDSVLTMALFGFVFAFLLDLLLVRKDG